MHRRGGEEEEKERCRNCEKMITKIVEETVGIKE
jgi:hypothetical protein